MILLCCWSRMRTWTRTDWHTHTTWPIQWFTSINGNINKMVEISLIWWNGRINWYKWIRWGGFVVTLIRPAANKTNSNKNNNSNNLLNDHEMMMVMKQLMNTDERSPYFSFRAHPLRSPPPLRRGAPLSNHPSRAPHLLINNFYSHIIDRVRFIERAHTLHSPLHSSRNCIAPRYCW